MLEENIIYASSNGEHDIKAKIWKPDNENTIIGILQIAHGMTEHKGRYAKFAKFLAEKGFLVCANDHAGHGESVKELYGYMGEENGHLCMLQDMRTLQLLIRSKYLSKPYFLLGHSMGAFLSTLYTKEFTDDLNGTIYSGIGGSMPCIDMLYLISQISIKIFGGKRQGKFVTKAMLNVFNRNFKPSRTLNDWISRDTKVIDDYLSDEMCNFVFTYYGYRDLLMLCKESTRVVECHMLKKDLPVFIFSGDKDPVGLFSKGVNKFYKSLIESGYKDVRLKLYKDGRHEMLNELNHKEVYQDVYTWLKEYC